MTLVLNHQPLLSGNKIVFLVCMLFITSCGIIKTTQDEPDKDAWKEEKEHEKASKDQVEQDTLAAKIPKDTTKALEKDSLNRLYPVEMKESYEIAVLLPLFLDPEAREKQNAQKIGSVALDYYFGLQQAFDTLKACGTDFNVHVFDTKNEPLQTQELIRNELDELNPDLIIGPLFTNNVKLVSEFSKQNKINMASPFAYVDTCVANNPYFLTPLQGHQVQAEHLTNLLMRKFKDYHIHVIHSGKPNQLAFADQVDSLVNRDLFTSYQKIKLPKGNWRTDTFFRDTLKATNNVVVIPSEDEVFVASILSKLQTIDTAITIIGLSKWLEFETLKGNLMEKFNMHFLANYHVNYNDPRTIRFIKSYRQEYAVEPNKYAIQSYDLTLLLGHMLHDYGTYFQRNWYDLKIPLIHSNFVSRQIKGNRGWENGFLNILEFDDFQLKNITN